MRGSFGDTFSFIHSVINSSGLTSNARISTLETWQWRSEPRSHNTKRWHRSCMSSSISWSRHSTALVNLAKEYKDYFANMQDVKTMKIQRVIDFCEGYTHACWLLLFAFFLIIINSTVGEALWQCKLWVAYGQVALNGPLVWLLLWDEELPSPIRSVKMTGRRGTGLKVLGFSKSRSMSFETGLELNDMSHGEM